MSTQMAASPGFGRTQRRCAGIAAQLLALLVVLTWASAPGEVRADTIVLKSGETVEGSIIDATRNTVVVQRVIGGMRQMPIGDIAEVRIGLAQGQRIAGQLLGWADGVYEVRSGGQVMRIADGDVLSRDPGAAPAGPPRPDRSPDPAGPQTVRMAAAPAPAAPEDAAADRAAPEREQMAVPGAAGEPRSPAAGAQQSAAAAEAEPGASEQQSAAAAEAKPGAGEQQSAAAAEAGPSPAAGADESAPAGRPSLAADEEEHAAADEEQHAAAGEQQGHADGGERSVAALDQDQGPGSGAEESLVAVKAFVAPADPGADRMVFRIELSRPVEQPVVLIYGTVEGTAKAGEDFEPQHGMVTLAPGTRNASVLVPLIEQPPGRGEKQFELFLAADPKVAEIVDRRVVATINGDG